MRGVTGACGVPGVCRRKPGEDGARLSRARAPAHQRCRPDAHGVRDLGLRLSFVDIISAGSEQEVL